MNSKICLILIAVLTIHQGLFAQTVTFETDDGLTAKRICKGTGIQLNLDIDPPQPVGGGNTYNVQWEKSTPQNFIMNCPFPSPGGTCSFYRDTPDVTTTYTVTIDGNIRRSVTITVDEVPNPGLNTTMFLCGRTGVINLFDELDGGPDTGGTWSNGTGIYDTSDPNGGAFTYTIDNGGACPPVSAVITVKPCGDNDSDNDGVPNSTDNDDDNDGIPDIIEDSFCTATTITPIFVLEEDFGFGGPTRSRYSEGLGLTYNPVLPQDINGNDGEYNVATSTHYRTNVGFDATFLATDLIRPISDIDADERTDGRYLAINMKSSAFADKPVFVASDLPVTPGIEYNFSMSIASLNNNVGERPANLTIEVVDQATGIAIFSEDSGEIPNGTDIWRLIQSSFIPGPTVTIVTIRVINRQNQDGNGNDIGIDNVFLSTNACDFDRDGIPNSEDLDADNDGIYDIVESGNAAADGDGDGRFDGPIDANGASTTVTHKVINSDTDTNLDFLDIDSDNDGIVDNIEGQSTAGYIAPSGVDGDFNGVDDSYDANGTVIIPVNTNTTADPDYIDTNSDPRAGDCLVDTIEAYDTNQDGTANTVAAGADTDGDGLDNAFDTVVLDRLTGGTNANNGGTTPADFPNNHNPLTPERDWREEIGDVDVGNLAITVCDPVNLFDELPAGTLTTGTWTVPAMGTALTGGHEGILDPSATGVLDGVYIYTLPVLAPSCPPIRYLINVTVDDTCRCPDIEEPVVTTMLPIVTCINASPLPSVNVTLATDLVGRWYLADGTTPIARAQNTATFTPTRDELSVGANEFRVEAYEPTEMCTSDLVKVTITVTAAPEAGEPNDTPPVPVTVCAGDTDIINLFDELTGEDAGGEWTDAGGTVIAGGTITANTNIAGDYTYTVSSNGCTDTAVVTVIIETIPSPGTGGTLNTCTGAASVNLFDRLGTPDPGGSWTDPNGNPFGTTDQGVFDPSTNIAGTYTYTTGTTTCNATATVEVTINTGANAGVDGDVSFCSTDTTANLFDSLDGTQDVGGTWTDPNGVTFGTTDQGVIDPSAITTLPGDYTYTVSTTSCPIADSAIVTVTIDTTPTLTLGGTTCAADRATYDVAYTTNGTWSITIVPAGEGTIDVANSMITGITAGVNITITATNPANTTCEFDLAITAPDCNCPDIVEPTNPSNESICVGSTAPVLSVDILTGQTANWYDANGILLLPNSTTYTPTDTAVGNYVYSVEALDIKENCPSDRIEVLFEILSVPVIDPIAPVASCESYELPVLTLGNYFTQMNGAGTQLNAGEIITTSQVLYVYAETGTTPNCFDEQALDITINPLPNPVAPVSAGERFCESYTLPNVLPGQNYYTGPDGTGTRLAVGDVIRTSQNIYLQEIDGNGCQNEIQFFVEILNIEEIELGGGAICLGPSVTTSFTIDTELSDANFSFEWSVDGTVIPGATQSRYEATQAGVYTVNYTDTVSMCSGSSQVTIPGISDPEDLILSLRSGAFTTNNNGIIADVVGNGEYEYSLDGGAPQQSNVFNNVSLGLHEVTAFDINGCGSITKEIFVPGFPTFFTPNNDGRNDTWMVISDENLPDMMIFVFDRYGKLLDQIDPDTGRGWDGIFNGIQMPSTDYWFMAKLADGSDTYRGHFTLKR